MGKYIFGGILILIGLAALGLNFAWLPVGLFWLAFRLWPLVLVAIGINLLFRGTALRSTGTILLTVFLLVLIGLGVYARNFLGDNGRLAFGPLTLTRDRIGVGVRGVDLGEPDKETASQNVTMPQDAERYAVDIDFSAGRVYLDGETRDLMDASFETPAGHGPRVDLSEGDTAELTVTSDRWTVPFGMSGNSQTWRMSFNNRLPADFVIDLGAAQAELDFGGINLETLNLSGGAAQADLRFGANVDQLTADIDMGAAGIKIRLPQGSAVRLDYDAGVSALDVPDDLRSRGDGMYETDGYADADRRILLNIDSGASDIEVLWYDAETADGGDAEPEDDADIDFTRINSGSRAPYDLAPEAPEVLVLNDYDRGVNTFDRVYRPESYMDDHLVLVLLYGSQPTGGYRIRTQSVTVEEDTLTVEVELGRPRRQDLVTQALTSPYDMIAVPVDALPDGAVTVRMVTEDGQTLHDTDYASAE
jgi:hypothetical protein